MAILRTCHDVDAPTSSNPSGRGRQRCRFQDFLLSLLPRLPLFLLLLFFVVFLFSPLSPVIPRDNATFCQRPAHMHNARMSNGELIKAKRRYLAKTIVREIAIMRSMTAGDFRGPLHRRRAFSSPVELEIPPRESP